MHLQFKGRVFVQAISLTIGLSAIAHLDRPLTRVSDENTSINTLNPNPIVPETQNPFSGKVWTQMFSL